MNSDLFSKGDLLHLENLETFLMRVESTREGYLMSSLSFVPGEHPNPNARILEVLDALGYLIL
jgi:hypothetical protein